MIGKMKNSVAAKIALIAIGPVAGLMLTIGVSRYSEHQRAASDAEYRKIQTQMSHAENLSSILSMVNSHASSYIQARTEEAAASIRAEIGTAREHLVLMGGAVRHSALTDRIGEIEKTFEELDTKVKALGRTSQEGLTDHLDKITEVLLALFDGAVSYDERLRPLANSYNEFRGTELRYRWKRDPKLENRIDFMRSALQMRLKNVDFEPQQVQILIDNLKVQRDAFDAWKGAAQEESFLRDGLVALTADAQSQAAKLRDESAVKIARERQHNIEVTHEAERLALISAALAAAISIALVALVGRKLATALAALSSSMRRVAEGEEDVKIPSLDRKDEVGTMAQALLVFQSSIKERAELTERAAQDQQQRLVRAQHIEGVISSFGGTIEGALRSLKNSAGSMHQTAETLDQDSVALSERAERAGQATATASSEVSAVAVTASQLSAAIDEVSRQAVRSTNVAHDAVSRSRRASEVMAGLVAEASQIGNVVALIRSITEQTNLLALNATIEAARAGESGKGFAVVANEVKELAAQTAHATSEIEQKVTSIQGASADVGTAIEQIDTILSEMNTIASSVAAAVEEQGSAISAISENVNVAAQNVMVGAEAIKEAEARAHAGRTSANDVAQAAQAVAKESSALEGQIFQFLNDVRSA